MRIEQFISNNSLTVADFAKLIGVKSRASIHRYMKGRVPKPNILERIFSVTDGQVTANDFYNLPVSHDSVAKKRPPHTTGNTKRQGKNPKNPPPG